MNTLARLAKVVEAGKINKLTPHPIEYVGQDGADELTQLALSQGLSAKTILDDGLMVGMQSIGEKFAKGEAYIPNMLIAARAMTAAMVHLKPLFSEEDKKPKGTLVLGTVKGDLHDIGKNLVKMIMKGDGWQVIDLGTDVENEAFVQAVNEHEGAIVGMSALLTTTMLNMESVVQDLHANNAETKIYIGGAPVSMAFSASIKADGYFRDPYAFASSLR